MFKQIINQPATLARADIKKWINDFTKEAYDIQGPGAGGIMLPNYNPTIFSDTILEFSDDLIVQSYVTDAIKSALERIFGRRLSKEKLDKIVNDIINDVLGDECSEEERSKIEGRLEELFGGIPGIDRRHSGSRTDMYALGKYFPGENRIVLYTKAIEIYYPNIPITHSYFAVAMHEMFHRYHHRCCKTLSAQTGSPNEYELRHDYRSSALKEALADYFAWGALPCGIDPDYQQIANAIAGRWNKYEPEDYPYAGARFINDPGHFSMIVDESSDFDKALKTLFCNDQTALYNVINAVFATSTAKTVHRRKTSVPTAVQGTPNAVFHNIPLYLIPYDAAQFEQLYESGRSYTIATSYNDGRTEFIGPVRSQGKKLKQGIVANIQSNKNLRSTNLTDAERITVYINF